MGSFLSRLWWGPEPEKPGGVDRKGSLPADYDDWRTRNYEPTYTKPYEPPPPIPQPQPVKPPTPEVTELQKVHETKLEREKITNDSGSTTEKTQFTQVTESTRIQESKGPVLEPFDFSSQNTVFPSFTEVKSTTTPTQDIKKHEILISTPQPTESEDLSDELDESKTDALVKIQAGVRGYLTRKALKERSVTPEPAGVPTLHESSDKEDVTKSVSAPSPLIDITKNDSTLRSSSPVTVKPSPLPSKVQKEEEEEEEEEEEDEEDEEEEEEDTVEARQAATKIQAAFRGYKVRKQGRPEPPVRKNAQKVVVDLDEEDEEEESSDEGTLSDEEY